MEPLCRRKVEAFIQNQKPQQVGAALLQWYQAEGRDDLPWRRLFRQTRSPYPVWISEIMLQQTVIKAVLPVFIRFMERFPTLSALAAAREEEVCEACRGLGYYRRFKLLLKAAVKIEAEGQWPSSYAKWRELPGIGDYTAAALASIVLCEPTPVVDGNVERVLARLLDLRLPHGDRVLKQPFYRLAGQLMQVEAAGDFNQAMMELGQRICTKQNPLCPNCPVVSVCEAYKNSSCHLAPAPKKRRETLELGLKVLVHKDRKGRIGMLERPASSPFLGGTYGFVLQAKSLAASAAPCRTASVGQFRHIITHHKLSVEVVMVELAAAKLKWHEMGDVEKRLVTSLDQKAWRIVKDHLSLL
jgi:A/G-specific adenine glycosylase